MDLPLDFTLPTTVHFAIKARDAAGNESALSNSPAADMPGDVTAPCAVAGLAAVRLHDPSDGIIPAGAASSTALYGRFTAGYAIDGDPATLWSSESSAAPRAEQLTLDLGAILVIGEIRLLPRPGYPMLFPAAFAVRTSIDGSTWTTAFDESGYAAAEGVWYERNLAGLAARFIRLDAPQSMRFALNGRYYVQLAEFQVYAPAPVRLRLSWTAPGDDGTAGTAATYDIRYALAPITAGPAWAAANPIPDPPAPQPAGSPQSMEASLDLSPGAIIFFAITSTDEAGNTSALSNSPSIELPAAIPP